MVSAHLTVCLQTIGKTDVCIRYSVRKLDGLIPQIPSQHVTSAHEMPICNFVLNKQKETWSSAGSSSKYDMIFYSNKLSNTFVVYTNSKNGYFFSREQTQLITGLGQKGYIV